MRNDKTEAYKKINKQMNDKKIDFSQFTINELKSLLVTPDGVGKDVKEQIFNFFYYRKGTGM